MSKIVFSSTLSEPLSWANSRLVAQDPIEAVREMRRRLEIDAHHRQPPPLSISPEGRPCRPIFAWLCFPSLPEAVAENESTRLSPTSVRHDQQAKVRRSHSTPRVRSDGPGAATRHHGRQRLTAPSLAVLCMGTALLPGSSVSQLCRSDCSQPVPRGPTGSRADRRLPSKRDGVGRVVGMQRASSGSPRSPSCVRSQLLESPVGSSSPRDRGERVRRVGPSRGEGRHGD